MQNPWENIKHQLKTELSSNSFALWIDPIELLESDKSTLILSCPNKFSRNWVRDNYSALIRKKLRQSWAPDADIILKTQPSNNNKAAPEPTPSPSQIPLPIVPGPNKTSFPRLNSYFKFENFVVGNNNEFAYSATKALSQGTLNDYNCLLLLAGTGLGKSHLSHALGHAILNTNPRSRVYYITAEDFANEMIFSLKNNQIEAFKEKYRRHCDVLLLEEIPFLSGKEKIQTELAYTLDALANEEKKILFTTSLPPKDIPRISNALSSRITSGLVTQIQKPDFATRVKIIKTKASQQNLSLPDEVVQLIAARLKPDVRQLESAIRCLKARAELLKAKLDSALAAEVINCLSENEHQVTVSDIKGLVCKYYKIDPSNLSSKSRKKAYAQPRNIFLYFCRNYTEATLDEIGKSVSRTHATVLHATQSVSSQIKTDKSLKHQVEFLSKKLEEKQK